MRKLISILAAFALTLAIAAPVAAATSENTTLTITVDSALELSGAPATIDLGHTPGGFTLTATPFTLHVVANTNFLVTSMSTGLTSGANVMGPAQVRVNGEGQTGAAMAITGAGTLTDIPVTVAVIVSSNAKAGVYNGSIQWAVTAQ